MKYVRRLNGEPALLTQYRLANPDELLRPPQECRIVWDNFKLDKPAYEQLLDELMERQQGLCIYCEQRLVDKTGKLVPFDYQVEHVLAKSGAAGRVLDWSNVALACCGGTFPHHTDESRKYTRKENTSCGQTKGDTDLPAGCDPRSVPLLAPLTKIGLDGLVIIDEDNCNTAGVSCADMKTSIDLLQVNCERLRLARQEIGDAVRSWFVFMVEELIAPNLSAQQVNNQIDLLIARQLQPDPQRLLPAFWSTLRSVFDDAGEDWLRTNQNKYI